MVFLSPPPDWIISATHMSYIYCFVTNNISYFYHKAYTGHRIHVNKQSWHTRVLAAPLGATGGFPAISEFAA